VTIIKMKSKEIVFSATRQDNRGAKPTLTVNSRRSVRLPLTGTVGEEETRVMLNFNLIMSFADQLIERREGSTQGMKSMGIMAPLSDRTYTRTAESIGNINYISSLQAVRSNREGRGAAMRLMKPILDLSSATRQDNRGAKPIEMINFKSMFSLPLTGTVGEEETNHRLNPRGGLSFADQEIEGARSITIMNPNYWMTSPSLWTYTRTAETNMSLNFIREMQTVRSNYTGRGVTICILKSTIGLSSATHEDRGAKPNYGIDSTAAQSLSLTYTIGEEETTKPMNSSGTLFFADQLIERGEAHYNYEPQLLDGLAPYRDLYSDGGTHLDDEIQFRFASRPKQLYGSRSDHGNTEIHWLPVLRDPGRSRGKAQESNKFHSQGVLAPTNNPNKEGVTMVTKVLTPKDFTRKMGEISKLTDHEERHAKADDLMCDLLSALGYDRGVRIFRDTTRFYA
jgi:hypothetical protein